MLRRQVLAVNHRRRWAWLEGATREGALGAVLALGMPFACASSSAPAPETAVVVGIQSEPLTGAVASLHVVTTLDGKPSDDALVAAADLPHEVRLTPPDGASDAAIGVRIDGYTQAGWTPHVGGTPVLVRTAEAHFVPGKTRLLRILLQGQCLLPLPGGPPGAPSCTAPQTCIGGVCQSDAVSAQDLEPYEADWPETAPDVCKPANAGPPVVQVGTGQSAYLPLTTGQTVQMEQGPQGGHHIWVAVRQENLKQSGSTTTLTSVVPTTGLAGPKTRFAFNFTPGEGGFCNLYGLRYQLDVDGTDYREFLGQPLDVRVTLQDASGTTGVGTAHVVVDSQLLCPSGIPGCP